MAGTEAHVIDRLYDGVADQTAWPTALTGLCDLVGADHAVSFARRSSRADMLFAASARIDPAAQSRFLGCSGGPMAWFSSTPAGSVFDFEAIIPLRRFIRTDFFNDIVRPMGGFRALCAVPGRGRDHESYLALCRTERAAPFGRTERAALARVLPHVTRALAARIEIEIASCHATTARHALDGLETPFLVVDSRLRLLLASADAERVLRSGDGLVWSHGTLAAGTPSETNILQRLVHQAAADEPRAPRTHYMRLTRDSSMSPWIVRARRIGGSGAGAGPESHRVIVVLEDPDRLPADVEALLRSTFELTSREAELAVAIASHFSIGAAARQLGIATATARGYLKSIFLKTSTHRQAALVALVHRLGRIGG